MSGFLVYPEETDGKRSNIEGCIEKLDNVRSQLENIRDNLGIKGSQGASVSESIGSVISKVSKESFKLQDFGEGLRGITKEYRSAEEKCISGIAFVGYDWIMPKIDWSKINPELGVGILPRVIDWEMLKQLGLSISVLGISTLSPAVIAAGVIGNLKGIPTEAKKVKTKAKNKEKWVEVERQTIFKESKQYNKEKGIWEDSVKDEAYEKRNKQIDAKLWGKDASASASLFEGEIAVENEYGKISLKAEALKASANASMYVGTLGAGAAVGASVTALHLEGEGEFGDDNLGGYVKGEVDVGKVEAKADIKVGIDADGQFNAKVGGSLEAIAGEASVKGGLKVAGADVGVKASVNYGIGVKANVGIEGGVVKLDLGATLGVGASVSLEVDVSKPVQAVVGAAASAAEYVGEAVSGLGKTVGKVGKFIGNLFG